MISLLPPGVWSTYEAVLLDTLELIGVPTIEVYDQDDNKDYAANSLLSTICIKKIVATAEEMFVEAIRKLEI